MLVDFFYKLTNNPNLFFFLGGGGGGGVVVGGGGVNIMSKWHFCSSRNTNVPDYSEILA